MTDSHDERIDRRKGVLFTEAAGKTVASIRLNEDHDWRALEIRFTDGTLFSVDLVPRIELVVRYMEQRHGDSEIIRDYGSLPEGGRFNRT